MAVLAFLLWQNRAHLLHGLDGHYLRTLATAQWDWMGFNGSLGMNPLQGLGDLFFPFNFNLTPSFWIMQVTGVEHPFLTYLLLAAELIAATFLVARAFGFSAELGITAGVLLAALSLPTAWPPIFYPLLALAPNTADLLLAQASMIYALAGIQTRQVAGNLLRASVLACLPILIAAANPLFFMVIWPVTGVSLIALTVESTSRSQALWRIGSVVAAVLVSLLSGAVQFLAGGILFSVPSMFSDELFRHQSSLSHASVLFQARVFTWGGPALVIFSVLGAVMVLVRGSAQKTGALLHLALCGTLILIGYGLIEFVPEWRGPQMIYFEVALWPSYAIFATAVPLQLGELTAYRFAVVHGVQALAKNASIASLAAVLIVLLGKSALKEYVSESDFPPRRTPVIDILRDEIGLRPGAEFRGSVATFTGVQEGPTSWMEQHAFDAGLIRELGNDHRFVGLWFYGIPTLQEYSHYITPPFYLVTSRLLARETDRQIRNVVTLTRVEPSLLASMGVRFVVTDRSLNEPLKLRKAMRVGEGRVLLYELPIPNTGGYSITNVQFARTAKDMLAWIKSSPDFTTSGITDEYSVPKALTRALETELRLSSGQVLFRGRSEGTSLVLLPLQYSHCAKLHANGSNAKLIRMNLAQVAILFRGAIDASIRYSAGPMEDADCRIRDYLDAKRLRMPEASTAFPLRSHP